MGKLYRYLIIHDEMSVEQKIVQAAHVACTISPLLCESSINLVVGIVPTPDELISKALDFNTNGINVTTYTDEDYHGKGITAFITDPLEENSPERQWAKDNTVKFVFK